MPVAVVRLVLAVFLLGAVAPADASPTPTLWRLALGELTGRVLVALHDVDGRLVVEDDDGGLTALDPRTGRVLWYVRARGPVDRTPLFAAGRVTFASGMAVLVVDVTTGERLVDRFLDTVPSASPLATDEGLFVPSLIDDSLRAYDLETSFRRWTSALPAPVVGPSAVVELPARRGLLVADAGGMLRLLSADIDEPGQIWVQRVGLLVGRPVVSDERVFVVDARRRVSALRAASGSPAWRVSLDDDADTTPVLAGDVLVVSTVSGMTAFDASTGARRWTITADERPVGLVGETLLLTKRRDGERGLRALADGAVVDASITPGAVSVAGVLIEWTPSALSARRGP